MTLESVQTMAFGQPSDREIMRAALTQLRSVSLATVIATADLQTRVDRKYVLRPRVFAALVERLDRDALALDVDGARDFAYESIYFDTSERISYLAAAHSRRRRFKIRTRTYTDSDACVLEIKTTGGRGQTIKRRWAYQPEDRDVLTPDAAALVDGVLGAPGLADALTPVLTTTYRRSTLLAADLGYRLTADTGLSCESPMGAAIDMGSYVLVETKSRASPTRPDRLLWAMGHRPVRISKYCIGMAALHPELPANKWHRTLHQHLQAR